MHPALNQQLQAARVLEYTRSREQAARVATLGDHPRGSWRPLRGRRHCANQPR